MEFDVLAAPAAIPLPRIAPIEGATLATPASVAPPDVRAVEPAAAIPHQVRLSFHEDLHVLMTRVIDSQTGDVVREFPTRQVLDMVADVMKRMRAREEG